MSAGERSDAVRLTADGRARLDELAQRQFAARATGDTERAREIRLEFTDGAGAIGAGAGRFVYPLPEEWYVDFGGECVVKLAVPNERHQGWDGRAQNRHEAAVWQETESPSLMPVIAADPDGYWLVMPRGESPDDDAAVATWVENRRATLGDDVATVELTEKNVVCFAGGFRFCDYGVPPRGQG